MKRFTLLIFFFFSIFGGFAQSISVKSFQALPMDMTASSLEGKRIDQNGEVAALIKIVTTETGFTFEAGALGIVNSQQRNGEVWVWVPRASRKITILNQKFGVLRDYRYPIEIEAGRTYEMVLTTAKIETIVKEEVRQQYLIFELEPKNATLEVNDQLWSVDAEGTALQFVDFGTYTYRVRAANYETDAGVVTVDDPNNPITIKVNLKSNFAEVTLKVDADAEIWVNNDKKGVRSWTGSLGKGTYKIECKQEGCETSMISREITAEMNGQTITLPAPRPIYGSLNVESTPIGATIYLDGKEMGMTPRYINEVLIGQRALRLVKEGYKEYSETVSVAKGERKQVKAVLNKIEVQQPIATTTSASEDQTFTVNGVSFTMKSVEGGTFMMGYDYDKPNTKPAHITTVNTFYMGETEVTQALWKAVMGTTLKQHVKDDKDVDLYNDPIGSNYPMYYVSWNDCQEFIRRLNQLTGKDFRLPTEAEWEYAARGGKKSKGYKYAGSNKTDDVAWYHENSAVTTWNGDLPRQHKVKKKSPNEIGLYDMSGNVEELCNDRYTVDYNIDAEISNSPVVRGGDYYSGADGCVVWFRHPLVYGRIDTMGFRLALPQ